MSDEADRSAPSTEMPEDRGVYFRRARYLGGLKEFEAGKPGALWVTTEYVGLKADWHYSSAGLRDDWHLTDSTLGADLAMTAVSRIGVDGGEVTTSKILPVAVFGLFGLAARGAKDRTFLTAYGTSGEYAAFEILRSNPAEVRAAIAPILRAVGVPFDDDPAIQLQRAANTPEPSIVDQLEKLAALHSSGALTDDEFVAFKAKLME